MSFNQLQSRIFELVVQKNNSVADHLAINREVTNGEFSPPEYFRKIRVAFLSNFTVQGLPEVFKVRSIFHNLWTSTYLGPYNQYAQEILNPESGLYKFKPQLVYLLIDSVDSDEVQINNLAETLRGKGMTVFLVWGRDIQKQFGEYWYTKYKDLGDLRLAPDAFAGQADSLVGKAVAVGGATKKCLVLDLDNTLWSGIVGEDGPDKVIPDEKLQNHILDLYKNGAILAINSRNNPEDALTVIEKHPKMVLRKNHFAAQRINWQDKVLNIKELASELMLGTDSFVFVDDDPFNLLSVKSQCPEVATLTPDMLASYKGFESLYLTDEDKRRGQMYAEEFTRRQVQSSLVSVEDFLRELSLEVVIKEVSEDSIARVAQLTQKTNQFNLTTYRYTEDQVRGFLAEGWKIWTVSATDRYGDYGIIGAQMIEPGAEFWRIDNFLLSCRILGRGIEKSFLIHTLEKAKQAGAKAVLSEYIPTAKNKLAEPFYKDNGFLFDKKKGDRYAYKYNLANVELSYPKLIKVISV